MVIFKVLPGWGPAILLFAVLSAMARGATDPHVRIAPFPDWVAPAEPAEDAAAVVPGVDHGVEFLLADRQVNVAAKAYFCHFRYRITAEAGLRYGAQIAVPFDPEYESVDFHSVRVIRDGAATDRLALDQIRIIQQEKDLDRQIYNGQMTALMLLDDIRVGDVVDFAYTRVGANPVFGGFYHATLETNWGSLIDRERIRILAPSNRPLFARQSENILKARVDRGPVLTEYLWTGRKVKMVEQETQTPVWFSADAFLQVTEFKSWGDVVDWALPLYTLPEIPSPAIAGEAQNLIASATTGEDRLLAVLDFVQRDIRYLGIELGPRSHRPSPPDLVLARRFGDCKDKALLLCALLRQAGIEAVPALTHSRFRHTLDQWLPSPGAFDHVIVRATMGERTYWIDPTLSSQAGGLEYRALPDYERALPLVRRGAALAEVESPSTSHSAVRVEETYDMPSETQPAFLAVKAVYYGAAADGVRAWLKEMTPEQATKYFRNSRARMYPNIEADGLLKWTDHPQVNCIELIHRYVISDLWRRDGGKSEISAEFYPLILRDLIAAPDSTSRAVPLGTQFPLAADYHLTLHLPHPLVRIHEDEAINDDAFDASVKIEGAGRDLTIDATFALLRDSVPAPQVGKYANSLQQLRAKLDRTITFDLDRIRRAASYRFNFIFAVEIAAILGLAGAGAFVLYRRLRTPPADPEALLTDDPKPLVAGWLILVALGVTLRPLVQAFAFIKSFGRNFDLRNWEALTSPENSASHPGLLPVVWAEILVNAGLLAGSVLLLFLFYRRSRWFPRGFIIFSASLAIFFIADQAVVSSLNHTEIPDSAVTSMVSTALAALVWIPYMIYSRRVRKTFVA